MCRAEFSLPSITAEEAGPEKKAPIRVKFEIPYFTVSGIQVIRLTLLRVLLLYHHRYYCIFSSGTLSKKYGIMYSTGSLSKDH